MSRKINNSREDERKKFEKEAREQANFYLQILKEKPEFQKLKPKERLFVVNYTLYNGNWKKALIMSGMTSDYYYKQGAKYLKRPEIQDAMEAFNEIVLEDKIEEIGNKLIDQNSRIAFTPRNKYFTLDGRLKPGISFDDLGEDECIIEGIERKFYGKDADREVVVYKWADRGASRKELIKLLEINSSTFKKGNINNNHGVLLVPTDTNKDNWEEM